jgi:glyoxylase-like metal-dependent hydrolase (beta-lactamase superfamily II)
MFSAGLPPNINPKEFEALKNSKTIVATGDHDVFGDGAVVLLSTPGHSPGHQSLFVRLASTGPVVLTGDLYHYPAERTFDKLPKADVQEQTRASRARVEAFLKKTGAMLWIQHDIVANAKLKKAPTYYE